MSFDPVRSSPNSGPGRTGSKTRARPLRSSLSPISIVANSPRRPSDRGPQARTRPGRPRSAQPLRGLGVELEVADQALVALDRVLLVERALPLLDQQQVGVAGLEDAQMAPLHRD